MLKIGTHNSATGEEGSFLSKLLTPFARCQSKTLVEQYKADCRFFDVRVKDYRGELYCHHGLWRSKKTVRELLNDLSKTIEPDETVYIELTWEGSKIEDYQYKMVSELIWDIVYGEWPHIYITRFVIKKGWQTLHTYNNVTYKGDGTGFLGIHGWRCLIPIPWFWAKVHGKVEVNEKEFILTDFL
jgi:hypothetical protein